MKILEEKDPILREKTKKFDFDKNKLDIEETIKEMRELMLQKHGLGLAAPQVGLSQRFFIMGDGDTNYTCFNPEIIEVGEDKIKDEEGCLSFPDLFVSIARSAEIKVRYQNEKGVWNEETLTGRWARCFAHELDHLNGILFVDKAGPTSLRLARDRRRKHLKKRARKNV